MPITENVVTPSTGGVMNVQAVGNHRDMLSFDKGLETVQPVEESGRNQSVKPKDDVAPSGEEATETAEKGVIRLLLAGHFQGVADIRLRINFADELPPPPTQNAQTAFANGTSGLVTRLEFKARELFGSPGDAPEGLETEAADPASALNEALTAFATGADDILASVKDGSLYLNSALTELREAFSALAATFGAPPAPAVEDTDDGSTTVTDVLESIPSTADETETAEAPKTAATLLPELQKWFDDEVAKLEAAMAESRALPPLSEPRGKGAAYGKFLEIYNSLTWGWESQAGTQEQAAGIDVLA